MVSPKSTAAAAVQEPEKPAEQPSKVPKPPARNIAAGHAEQYFDYQDLIPAEEWSHLCAYLYRTWPIIIRQKADDRLPNYIDKFAEPVSLDQIRKRWGAGEYQLRLTDNNKNKFGEICSVRIVLKDDWTDFPPVLNPAELDEGHKDNQVYVTWARSKGLMSNGTTAAPVGDAVMAGLVRELLSDLRSRRPANDVEAQMTAKILNMFEDANRKSIDMVSRGNDPKALLEMLVTFRGLLGSKEGSNDKFLELLMLQQKRNDDLMLKLLETKQPSGGGLSQVGEILDLVDRIAERAGVGSKKSGWIEEIAHHAIDKIPETIREARDLFAVIRQASVVPSTPPGPGASAAAPPQPGPPQLNPTAAAPPPADEGGGATTLHAVITQFGGLLINALNRGTDGDQFAESIDSLYGPQVYFQICNLGKDKILAALKAHEIWNQLAPLAPQIDQFIDDFIAYGRSDGEENENPEDPTDPK